MKIYLIKRTDKIGYDEYDEKVVCAKNEQQARELASLCTGDEGKEIWLSERTIVEEIKKDKARIVLESFNAG